MGVYYSDDKVTLYHGDCLEHPEWWTGADVLVTDPPYGRAWRGVTNFRNTHGGGTGDRGNARSILSDEGTETRDEALDAWGDVRPAVMFGDLMLAPPPGTKLVCIYAKARDAGIMGAMGGFRRDAEAIYLLGSWPVGIGGRSSVLYVGGHVAGPTGPAATHGHPHAKPDGLMAQLVEACPPGTIADPFAGSGSTLVAAKALGRNAVGVELEERYCEIAARRLSQEVFDFGALA